MQNNVKPSQKNFNLMVLGQIISILGSALLRSGLSLYVLDMTGKADIYATLYAISNIPLLFSPIGGAIADRFNRRNMMVIFDFISSFTILCFFFVLIWGNATIFMIGIVMVLLGTISSMYQPAVQSSIPLLVEKDKLEQSNGIVSGVGAISNVTAPVLGSILYGMLGLNMLVLVSCITFLLSAIMEIFIQIPFIKRTQEEHIIPTIAKDMKMGFAFVLKQSFIKKALIIAALLNMVLTPFFVIGVPVILRVTMKSNDVMYGIGVGMIQFSTILGALSIGFFSKKMSMKKLYRWLAVASILLLPTALSLFPKVVKLGYYPSYLLFIICMVPIAMIMTIMSIFILTRVQRQTPNELLGKVMSIIMAVAQCAAPVGQIIYGVIFEKFHFQIYIPILILFVLLLLMTVWAKKIFKNEQE